jgi:hypothetical protein
MKDPIFENVYRKLEARQRAGYEEYGTTMADNKGDLRYWVTHLQEEMMDSIVYAEKILEILDRLAPYTKKD